MKNVIELKCKHCSRDPVYAVSRLSDETDDAELFCDLHFELFVDAMKRRNL